MKPCTVVLLALVAALYACPLNAQAQPRGETQIVRQVLTELSPWRNISSEINIEELQVSYVAGKLLEQNVDVLNEDLSTSQLVSIRILTRPRLSDHISLMGLWGSRQDDIGTLQKNIADFAPGVFEKPNYQAWSARASDAVSGPLLLE
jgi:hypothetical protein